MIEFVEFLIKTVIKLAFAAVLALLIIGVVALFGRHIGWWSAYIISIAAVYFGVVIFGDDEDWID
ncbi:hypothetical protein [Amycolatopsis sp. cg9]|uniref:hypothetical protein n=1 Tax=Amycolatopsis sp. cg9 TaxID=3238801 RepID=UPI00352536AB